MTESIMSLIMRDGQMGCSPEVQSCGKGSLSVCKPHNSLVRKQLVSAIPLVRRQKLDQVAALC